MNFKIGHSFDLHTLESGENLVLGGVNIHHYKGLKGHSDADVLVHAICESLIGAMGKGDIGTFFPDTDDKYKNISSLILLKEINDILLKENYSINNIDAIIFAQKPKLLSYIPEMKEKIAEVLKINSKDLNIKCTTYEKVDAIGQEKAIAAESICLLSYDRNK